MRPVHDRSGAAWRLGVAALTALLVVSATALCLGPDLETDATPAYEEVGGKAPLRTWHDAGHALTPVAPPSLRPPALVGHIAFAPLSGGHHGFVLSPPPSPRAPPRS